MSRAPTALKCPVCGARFRGTIVCSRCGGDLEPLMRIVVRAWRLRRRAALALLGGDADSAFIDARLSRRLHDTEAARKIELIARIVDTDADKGKSAEPSVSHPMR